MTFYKNNLKWCWLSLVIILLDQLSKYLVMHSLTLYQPVAVLPFFNLTLLHNTGAAFGFLAEHPTMAFWLFSGIAVVMSIALLIWLYRLPANKNWQSCALALVLGGAIGNLLDRFIHGHVIDFLDFYYQDWHFAAFNAADSAISVGAAMLVMEVFFRKAK
jgi:signal peptidase II